MNWSTEKCIDFYYGEYKQGGIFGKKRSVKLGIYPSYIEGKYRRLFSKEKERALLWKSY